MTTPRRYPRSAVFVGRHCVDCGVAFQSRITDGYSARVCGDCSRLVNGTSVYAELIADLVALRELLLVRP